MKLGLDPFLEREYKHFLGKRIGLITNMTGVNGKLIPTIDLFHQHTDIQLTSLFGPEHGIRGDAMEGEEVPSGVDPYTNVPVYSLYGDTKKPTKEMLEKIDVLVFDLQDIGSRYYTFIYTMAYAMEACAEHGKSFIVLDRPNPISGNTIEGNLVEEDCRSFVSLLPIPNRHGMTVGELALLFKHEFHYACDLTVISMEGWKRSMYYEETGLFWVPSSPNTTDIDMSLLYTGTCLLEGTNVSEGRGTTMPFELLGAPYIDGHKLAKEINSQGLPGIIARPTSFKPTYQKYKNENCGGVQLHIVDRNQLHSLKAGVKVLEIIAKLYPHEFSFTKNDDDDQYFFDLLAGTKKLKDFIIAGETERFFHECKHQLEMFDKKRKRYLLYN